MTHRIVIALSLIALLIPLVPAAQAAPARQVEFPPFNWSTAQWDPTNGGYCNAGGMCALPHGDLPPGWGQECTTAWCTYPSNDLAVSLGIEGGLAGEGRGCDYSTDCFTSWGTNILPPPQAECPSTRPICQILYPNPTPPAPTPPGVTPPPTTGECPLNLRVSQQPPTIAASKIAPAYPIVVGQDTTKRGVDVSASIRIYPVIVKYDVPKYKHECQYVGGTVTDSACQNQVGWKNQKVFAGCETKTEVHPDRIAFATLEADLEPESIQWITTDLAAKYPGAHVYQAHWSLWPGRAPSQGGMSPDGANLNVLYGNLPLADPGAYSLQIQGTTTGTPYTQPRSFSFTSSDFDVHLLESTIIR